MSGLVILECFRFATLFTLAAISFSVLCSCLLNSIHYRISQLSWQCHLPIQHRITVVWAVITYLCHTLLTPGGKQLSLAQNIAVQELSSVWFLTFILNRSTLMTFITDNETYSVYSTSFTKVIWDLSQSFCLQATKQYFSKPSLLPKYYFSLLHL